MAPQFLKPIEDYSTAVEDNTVLQWLSPTAFDLEGDKIKIEVKLKRMPRCGKKCFLALSMPKYFVIVMNKYFFVEADRGLYPIEVVLSDDRSRLKTFNRFNINIVSILPRANRDSNRGVIVYQAPDAEKAPSFTALKKSSNGIYAVDVATSAWTEGATGTQVTKESTVVNLAPASAVQ